MRAVFWIVFFLMCSNSFGADSVYVKGEKASALYLGLTSQVPDAISFDSSAQRDYETVRGEFSCVVVKDKGSSASSTVCRFDLDKGLSLE